MKLTSFDNGMIIDVDQEKIESFGPHSSGGSFIIVNGHNYHVLEKMSEILSKT